MQNSTPNRGESFYTINRSYYILFKLKNLHCVHISLQFQTPEIHILVILV